MYPSDGSSVYEYNITPEDSIFGHKAVPEVIAVGAVVALGNGYQILSSRGPVTISYPTSKTRSKPDLCGIDGVSVSGAEVFQKHFSEQAPHVHRRGCCRADRAQFPHKRQSDTELLINNAKDLAAPGGTILSGTA